MHRNAPLTPEGRLRLCHRIESRLDGRSGGRIDEHLPAVRPQVVAPLSRRGRRRPRGSLQPAAVLSASDPGAGRATDRGVAPVAAARARPGWRDRRGPGLDGAPGPRPPRREPAAVDGPADRRVVRRIETSRCGELVHIDVKKLARVPDGGGHKMLGRASRPTDRGPSGAATPTSTPPSTPTRRLAYSEFAGTENTPNCVAFLGPSHRLVRHPRHQRRTDPDRQRQRLPQPRLARPMRRARHQPHPHPALPARHQRQGRTLQPHPRSTNGPTPDSGTQTPARARTLDRFLHRYNHR